MDKLTIQQLMKANEMYERRKQQNREAQRRFRSKTKDVLKQHYVNVINPDRLGDFKAPV